MYVVNIHTHTDVHVFVCVYTYIHICICVHVYPLAGCTHLCLPLPIEECKQERIDILGKQVYQINICALLCAYVETQALLTYDFSYQIHLLLVLRSQEWCVCETERERETLQHCHSSKLKLGIYYRKWAVFTETFYSEHQEKKKCKKNSRTTLRTKLSKFGAKDQRPGSPGL